MSQEDIQKGEAIGIVVAIIVLVLVFGAAVAAVTPIIMGLFAIVVGTGIVALIGQVWSFSFFVPELMTMMGLAVGIDYSLFIVSRYREERARGYEKLDAIGAAGATANRAVFFSGLTVVLALLGMLIIPTTIFRGLAGGAIIVVAGGDRGLDDPAARRDRAVGGQAQCGADLPPQAPRVAARTRRRLLGSADPSRHEVSGLVPGGRRDVHALDGDPVLLPEARG